MKKVDMLVGLRDGGVPVVNLPYGYYLLQLGGFDSCPKYTFSVMSGRLTARGSRAVMSEAKALGYLSAGGDITWKGERYLAEDVLFTADELDRFNFIVSGCIEYADNLYTICVLDIVLQGYSDLFEVYRSLDKILVEVSEITECKVTRASFDTWFRFLHTIRGGIW